MKAQQSPPRPASAAEAGFTLIEVLVVSLLLSLVVSALMAPLVLSQRAQTRDMNYAYAQQQARTALESIVTQVRAATAINSVNVITSSPISTNSIDMNITLGGATLHVVYDCAVVQPNTNGAYRECLRAQAAPGVTPNLSTGTVVATNLLNGTTTDPVFTLGPSATAPYYMTATFKVPSSGGTSAQGGSNIGLTHQIVFTDGALMRNLNIGN